MKTIQITLLLFLGVVTLRAQSFYVGFQGAIQYNRILNKEDARAKANLTRPPSFSPVVGIPLGYRFGDNAGLRSFQTGVYYQGVNQLYEGYTEWSAPRGIEATLNLTYIHVPLELTIPLIPSSSKVTPFLSVGGFVNYLVYYKDHMKGYFSTPGDMENYRILTGNRYQVLNGVVAADWTTDKWFYTRWLFGVSAGIGTEVKLSDGLSLVMHAKGNYSVNDPEYKKDMKFYKDGVYKETGVVLNGSTAKYFTYLPGVKNGDRPPSKLFNAGLQVGILYHFSKNLNGNRGY